MTEAEWLRSTDVGQMERFLRDHPASNDRKLRLFGCACCRRVWRLFRDERSQRVVELAERYADGLVTDPDLTVACQEAMQATEVDHGEWQPIHGAYHHAAQAAWWMGLTDQPFDAGYVSERCYGATVCDPDDPEIEDQAQAALLRDIFGNPFRPVAFDPRWRTSDTLGLARAIYEDRAFDRLPVLADALMDAGCADEQVLEHCRSDGPHARGCWVVDLVLGKE